MNLDYVVTGTGRCGSVFMARVLTSAGIPCGHESIFDYMGIQAAEERLHGERSLELSLTSRLLCDGVNTELISPYLEDLAGLRADSSYMAAPYLEHMCLEPTSVIHVVRNPILVVNSFLNYLGYFTSTDPASEHGQKYESYIYEHLPVLKKVMPAADRAALYWVKWNEIIEWNSRRKSYVRLRAEDGPLPLLYWLKVPPQKVFDDRTVNTYKKHTNQKFSIDQIQSSEIKKMFIDLGVRYGYIITSENVFV